LDSRALLDAERGVDDEHLSWPEPSAPDAGAFGEWKSTRFRRAGDETVVGNGVAEGPQAVAVKRGADDAPVCEDDPCRAVPRLEKRGVIAVEGANVLVQLGVGLDRLRQEHRDPVADVASAADEQLE